MKIEENLLEINRYVHVKRMSSEWLPNSGLEAEDKRARVDQEAHGRMRLMRAWRPIDWKSSRFGTAKDGKNCKGFV